MLYKYGKRNKPYYFYHSFLYFGIAFNFTISPLALVGYAMIIANSIVKCTDFQRNSFCQFCCVKKIMAISNSICNCFNSKHE